MCCRFQFHGFSDEFISMRLTVSCELCLSNQHFMIFVVIIFLTSLARVLGQDQSVFRVGTVGMNNSTHVGHISKCFNPQYQYKSDQFETKTLPCNGIVPGMYVLLDSRLAFSLKTVYQIYLNPILLYFHDWPGFYGFQSVVMHQWTALFHVIVHIYTLRFTCLVVYCQICVIEQSSTRCTNHLCPTSTTFIPPSYIPN